MNGKVLLLLSSVWVSACVSAKTKPPAVLTNAVSCLAKKNNFPLSSKSDGTFGYWLDTKSYPGESVIYVVNYINDEPKKGFVFVIFFSRNGDTQSFNIQNNATFLLSEEKSRSVKFVNPPLGGLWTQEHIVYAINKIEDGKKFIVPIIRKSAQKQPIVCTSYTDKPA